MNNEQAPGLAVFAQFAMGMWLFSFVFPLLSATIANGILKVPLYQIVNADFAVVLFFLAFFCAFVTLLLVVNLIARSISGVFACLFLLLLYVGQSLAGAAAYLIYAWIDGVDLQSSSFVYQEFTHVVAIVLKAAGTTLLVGKSVNWWQTMEGVATVGGCLTFLSSAVSTWFGRSALAQA